MSKQQTLQNLIQAVKKWPAESHKVYTSFHDVKIARLEELSKLAESKFPQNMDNQIKATQLLTSNSNKRKFPVSDALYAPQGMPTYYARISREADKQLQQKESFVTSFREAALGWFK